MKKYLSFLMIAILVVFASCSKDDDEKSVYTVTFETDGGTPVPAAQRVEQGSMAAAPATHPTKTGYVFSYWHVSGATAAYNFQTPVNGDMTLYAKWQEQATAEYWQVTWNLNGGTWPSGNNHATQVLKGGTLAEPAEPAKTDHTFEGWYKDAALTEKINFPYDVSSVTGNFTLYAKWVTTETQLSVSPDTPITFTNVGGTSEAKTITVTTNQTSWDAVSNQTWCTITKSGNQFTVTAAANTGSTSRDATITVSAGKAENVVIQVTQTAAYTEDKNLEKAIYTLGYAANAADQYNNKGLKPSTILLPGTTNEVALSLFYLPNGALDYGTSYIPGRQGSVYGWIYYGVDMGRRPFIMTYTSSTDRREKSLEARTAIRTGSYDYKNDPQEVIAYFGSWTGSSVFTSLDNLKLITNNNAITEQVYKSISFSTNCYKMIVFGKNSSGELMGKYVGYSTNGKSYIYWCIDPASPSFGERITANTPYN